MPTCVSWHAKGTCFDNCRRTADHIQHSATEREQFHGWCQRPMPRASAGNSMRLLLSPCLAVARHRQFFQVRNVIVAQCLFLTIVY